MLKARFHPLFAKGYGTPRDCHSIFKIFLFVVSFGCGALQGSNKRWQQLTDFLTFKFLQKWELSDKGSLVDFATKQVQ